MAKYNAKKYTGKKVSMKPKPVYNQKKVNNNNNENEETTFLWLGGAWKKKYGYSISLTDDGVRLLREKLQDEKAKPRLFLFWAKQTNENSPNMRLCIPNGDD